MKARMPYQPITNEPIFINVIREGFYTFDVGIDLTNNEEDNFL